MNNAYFICFCSLFADFGMDNWKQLADKIIDDSLTDFKVSKLLEDSYVGYYLQSSECKIPPTLYKWNNGMQEH